ncbi:hypothetical protein LCGC14_2654200, partial [marine sediment metagenome]
MNNNKLSAEEIKDHYEFLEKIVRDTFTGEQRDNI